MRIGVWLLSFSFLFTLAAQGPPIPPGVPSPTAQPEARAEDQCSVEGMVLNAKTKQPLGKARVGLMRMDRSAGAPAATTTDASGRFKLTGIPPGPYLVAVTHNGFSRQVAISGNAPPTLTLAPKQALKDLTLELAPAAVIAGRVVDQDGEPLANVQLLPFRYVSVQGTRQLSPAGGSASTDDQGGYRIFGLDPGRYYVSATYSGAGRSPMAFDPIAPATPEETYPSVFFPGVASPSQATPIQLRAGEERRGVDFRLAPVRSIRIRGRLAPLSEQPRLVRVTLPPRGDGGAVTFGMGPRPPAMVDPRGGFEIRGVMPGSYTLTAMSMRDGNPLTANLPVEAGTVDIEGIELALKAGVEVKGKVRFDDDSQSNPKLAGLTINLMPAQATMGFAGAISAPVDAEGAFNLRHVTEGDYRVKINPMAEGAYIKTVMYGGADTTRYPLTVGEAPGKLEVTLGVGAGEAEGTVTDGDKPVAGALVAAVPDSGRDDMVRVGRTDSSGHYSVHGLAPGGYTLYACDDRTDGFSADPEGLKAYRNKGKTISVEEKSKATADLALIHTQDE
jgi:protocatechuate 3,4-dioxygenase beta subunit